jgi:DNA replication protein DnaC
LDIYDAVLLDDINISLPEWKFQLLEEILFQLYNRGAYIFLTSNSSLEELRNSLSGAIWSRLEERCIFQEFPEGEDVRKRLKKERLGV